MEKILDIYKYTLEHLQKELSQEMQGRQKSPRTIRKLERKIAYYRAYISLISSCLPILSEYYTQPMFVINRFWKEYCTQNSYCYEAFPGTADFFEWFCHSNTINEENRHSPGSAESKETLYLSLLQVYPDWLFPDKCV